MKAKTFYILLLIASFSSVTTYILLELIEKGGL